MKNSILIIDDEVMNIRALMGILNQDYTVYAERNSVNCMETVKRIMPDIILLDIFMPDVNGFEVLEQLKNDPETKDISVVLITGLTTPESEVKGFRMGAMDYIYKPFNATVVKMRIQHQATMLNQMRTIKNMSVTDGVTGVGNRRFFDTTLVEEWARAKRQQMPLGMMIMDLNKLKLINDTYGHLAGDIALQSTTKMIKSALRRASDKLARLGGDEFAVISPNTTVEGITKLSEDVYKAVDENIVVIDDEIKLHVTVSIGVHSVIPERVEQYTMNKFIFDTDKAMYHAKKTLRNGVCVVGNY